MQKYSFVVLFVQVCTALPKNMSGGMTGLTGMIVLVILILTFIFIFMSAREDFSSKREKASRIHEWFSNSPKGTYSDYRGALDGKSNIVEYEDVKKLFDKKDFTVSSVESVI